MFNRKEFKKAALESLVGRWKTPILSEMIYVLVSLFLYLLIRYVFVMMDLASANSVLAIKALLLFLLFFIFYYGYLICISPVFKMGFKNVIVKTCSTNDFVSFKEFFMGFKTFGQSMGAYWWHYLWIFLWALAFYLPFIFIMIISIALIVTEKISLTVIGIIILSVFLLCMIGFLIYKSISYSMMWYILCEEKMWGPIEAMKISINITKKNCGKLFLLNFSFIGWMILSILTAGIGFLWLIPYMEATNYHAYKFLRDEYYDLNKKNCVDSIENKTEKERNLIEPLRES